MKYDDASWHHGGNFPADLPREAGATHIAMFVAWAVLNGLAGHLHKDDFVDDLKRLENKAVTPGAWFIAVCDGKFTDEDLNEDGNSFAEAYYADHSGLHTVRGSYIADYEDVFPEFEVLYEVPDVWETYSKLKPVIQARYDAWRKKRDRKSFFSKLLR